MFNSTHWTERLNRQLMSPQTDVIVLNINDLEDVADVEDFEDIVTTEYVIPLTTKKEPVNVDI